MSKTNKVRKLDRDLAGKWSPEQGLEIFYYHLDDGEIRQEITPNLQPMTITDEAYYNLTDMMCGAEFGECDVLADAKADISELRAALQWIVRNDPIKQINGGDPFWFSEQVVEKARKALGDW